jgi:hypothetical protein
MIETLGTHLNKVFAFLGTMMEFHELSLHYGKHSTDDSKLLKQARKDVVEVQKKFGKHEPILDTLHEEFDKTVEARKHGKQIYR